MSIKDLLTNSFLYDWLGKRSFAQAGEDLIVASLFSRVYRGYYLDVGAYHPKQFSNTYFFYKRGWRGINIEPNSKLAGLFRSSRPGDKTLEMGVGSKEGKERYFVFEEATRNTFDVRQAEAYQKQGQKLLGIDEKQVVPLKNILLKYAKRRRIDLLSVDTEGLDLAVLKSHDWQRWPVRCVIVETETAGKFLTKKGYRLVGLTPYSLIFSLE